MHRTPHPDPEREDLIRIKLCFNYKKRGHLTTNYPLRIIYEFNNVPENGLLLLKTW
jgi:hypothetical protein